MSEISFKIGDKVRWCNADAVVELVRGEEAVVSLPMNPDAGMMVAKLNYLKPLPPAPPKARRFAVYLRQTRWEATTPSGGEYHKQSAQGNYFRYDDDHPAFNRTVEIGETRYVLTDPPEAELMGHEEMWSMWRVAVGRTSRDGWFVAKDICSGTYLSTSGRWQHGATPDGYFATHAAAHRAASDACRKLEREAK